MALKVAFVGFRHGHVGAMYNTAQRLDYVDVVACVEEDPAAREGIAKDLGVTLTHETFDEVLADTDFDVLVCVDYYARRATHALKALQTGKHVCTDKPLCTSLDDLKAIATLAREKNLQVGVDLTMRYGRPYTTLARIVREGGIGKVSSCIVTGLHNLAYGTRPNWYFEEGKQAGTLNDLMIHGVDLIRWATGSEYTKVIAATATCHRAPVPFFQDSAQVFYELEGGIKYLGDCSYMAPENCPEHWRFLLWGSEGSLFAMDDGGLKWYRAGEGEQEVVFADDPPITDPFEDFASSIARGTERWVSNEECFRSTAAALAGQLAADTGQRDLPVPTI
jgi:predicted dehydrogenase